MSQDPYVYPGTDVLKNLLEETDQDRLSLLERDISLTAMEDLRADPVQGAFDAAHLREIHRRIFKDVYPFAGRDRTIPLTKDEIVLGGRSVRYAEPGKIAGDLERTTRELAFFKFDPARPKASTRMLATHHAVIWKVHAFREGNTRAIMAFMLQHAKENGFELNPAALSRHPSETRDALALAAEGQDGDLAKLLHGAWLSQRERTHPLIGRMTGEASEVLKLLGDPPVTAPSPGETAFGKILTTTYDVVLLHNSKGVHAVHKDNFRTSGHRNGDRADVVVTTPIDKRRETPTTEAARDRGPSR